MKITLKSQIVAKAYRKAKFIRDIHFFVLSITNNKTRENSYNKANRLCSRLEGLLLQELGIQ